MSMENFTRRQALRAGALGLMLAGFLSVTTEAGAASTIETIYKAAGPWPVATGTSGGHRLYYPQTLGSGGVTHPIEVPGPTAASAIEHSVEPMPASASGRRRLPPKSRSDSSPNTTRPAIPAT